jgi:hypothetical protein
MRTTLTATLILFGLVAAPAAARAQALGCLVGPTDTNPCSVGGGPAALLGAIAAPVIVAGAAVSVAHELTKRTEEREAGAGTPTGKRPSLALVPDPPDPYREPAGGKKETRNKPSAAFQFNETATNVATAVTGAMVVGAVIATIVHEAHK